MAVSIWTERTTKVVEPNQDITFEYLLSRADGSPASNSRLQIRCDPQGAVEAPKSVTADESGRARVTFVAGGSPAKVDFTLKSGSTEAAGTLYVTHVAIGIPHKAAKLRDLSSEDDAPTIYGASKCDRV